MDDNHDDAQKGVQPPRRAAPSVTITTPTLERTTEFIYNDLTDEYEQGYLEGTTRDAGSQSSLDSLGDDEEDDYVYLLLKPPEQKEILVNDSEESDDNSIGRSASVRSAPADIDTGISKNGNTDSPRLKRKSAIRRHSTFANRSLDHRPGLSRSDTAGGQDLSRSVDCRDKPRRSLLDVQEEYFTLNIGLQDCRGTVKCKVEQGTSLRYILSKVAEDYSFELSEVDVFVESSQTPFPLDTPTYALARRNLHVRINKEAAEKEASSHTSAPIRQSKALRDSSSPSYSSPPQNHMAQLASDVAGLPDEFNSGRRKKDLSQFLGVNKPSTPAIKGKESRRSSVPGLMTPKTRAFTAGNVKMCEQLTEYYDLDTLPNSLLKDIASKRNTIELTDNQSGVYSRVEYKNHEKFDPKSFALQEKLDQFSIHGLPPFPKLLSISDRGTCDDQEIFELEESWRNIIKNASSMDKKDQDQMEAIWEIFKTENRCIRNLRIVIDLYMCTLLNIQASSLLNGIRTEKIFANIIEIEKLHIQFWREHIMKCLKKLRTEKKPLTADDISIAFKDFTSIFIPYFKFCPEEGHCVELVRTLAVEDVLFKQYLDWCEKRRESERKKLSDLLVYPMQRLTKYPLLISAVAKKTTDERMKMDVLARADEVDQYIRRINHEVTRHQEQCKLDNALARIEGYEGVNMPSGCDELAKLAEEHASLDLSAKMPFAKAQQSRWLLYESPIKIRDQDGRFDVYVFLFTDAFVVTKPKKDKFKVIRPPLRIDKLYVQELKDKSGFAAVCVNDYKCASYGFVATTGSETSQKWMERIAKAKELYNYACTEDTDDFFDNISISQSSEPTDTSSGISVDVDTPTGSPASSPVPSPKTPHRRTTTSMFEMSPPDIPGVLREEAEEEHQLEDLLEESTEPELPEHQDLAEELIKPTEQDNNNEDDTVVPPSPTTPVTPCRKVPPIPMPRRVSESDGNGKKIPPPISPKPKHPNHKQQTSFGATTAPERTGRGDSFHKLKLEENQVKSIMAYDSDDEQTCLDDASSRDPYINPDAAFPGRSRFKKATSTPIPGKRTSPRGSPRRFASPNRRDVVCKVNNHQLMKQCNVDGNESTLDTDARKHKEGALNGSAAIISHC